MFTSFAKSALISLSFFALWTFVGFNLANLNSPTFDEPIHYQEAVLLQQGKFAQVDPMETPFLRRVVLFSHQNTGLSPRQTIVIITGLLASLLVFLQSQVSVWTGWLTVFLFLSEPNLLAHGSLFTTDVTSALLLALVVFFLYQKNLKLIIAFTAFAAATKVATLSLLGPLFLLHLPRFRFKKLLTIVAISLLFIWATYGFRFELPFRQFPFPLPFGGYLRALKENFQFAKRGHPLFFQETLYYTGPWFKQILVFLFKTPPLHLLLGLLSLRFPLALFIIFLVNSSVGLHFGIRHLFPATLILILGAARLAPRQLHLRLAILLLVLAQTLAVYRHLPQLLTYSNIFAGPQPYRIFTDSDYDWGQGLISLKRQLQSRGITTYQLAYFGNVDPVAYLPRFQRLSDSNLVGSLPISPIDPSLPQIISVTCYYQCGYYLDSRFKLESAKVIAQSFLLFTHD